MALSSTYLFAVCLLCRLKSLVLEMLPVATKGAAPVAVQDQAEKSPIRKVLRSKGFMWMEGEHNEAFYWSHAGQHFEIRDEGDWRVQTTRVDPDIGCRSVVRTLGQGPALNPKPCLQPFGTSLDTLTVAEES